MSCKPEIKSMRKVNMKVNMNANRKLRINSSINGQTAINGSINKQTEAINNSIDQSINQYAIS